MRFTSGTVVAMVRAVQKSRAQVAERRGRLTLLKLLRDNPDFIAHMSSKQSDDVDVQQFEKLRSQSREWADRSETARSQGVAAAFTARALEALASVLEIELAVVPRLPGSTAELDCDAVALAQSIGFSSAKLPLMKALHFVSSLYPALLPEHTRSRLGAFYTPPALTGRLLDLLTEHGADWETARVLDPAAGAGAFLLAAAERMLTSMSGAEPAFILRQLGTRLAGLEIDAYAAVLAQASLELRLADVIRASGKGAPQFVRVCDSLQAWPDQSFDVVLGNPPYGRVTLASEVRERFARSLYGHANLYGVFTDLALRWTKSNGLIAFLTPTSVLSGQYFSALRSLLASEAPPVAIDFVHARRKVFEDVQQETMLAVYRRHAQLQRTQIHYLYVDSPTVTRVLRNGTIALPEHSADPWLAPRSAEHSALISRAEGMGTRLTDLGYRVATGPLVWNRFKNQLRDDQCGGRTHPLIWAEAVCTDGSFRHRAERKSHSLFFELRNCDDWLLVKDAAVLVQRTTAKEQRRRIIAAELPAHFVANHGGVVVENHLNMVVPVGTPKIQPKVLACLLNSEVVDQLFRCISGSVAVSAYELEALPLPAADAFELLTGMVNKGASRSELDKVCSGLYGLAE